MKAAFLILTALLLVGCESKYRYECQNPENKDNPECTRPACEISGVCFDTLNGIPAPQPVFEESAPAADCNCETTGE